MPLRPVCFILLALILVGLLDCGPRSEYTQLHDSTFTFVTSDQVRLPVKIAGRGYPCMFVPGGPGGGYRSFEQLGGNRLEPHLTMIWMDQRGSGDAQPAKDYSLERVLKDMDELRARLKIDRMYLMCHSFGGIIQINYAKRYPQHVQGLIFVNATLHFFGPPMLREQIAYGYQLMGRDTLIRSQNRDSLLAANMAIRYTLRRKRLAHKFLTEHRSTIAQFDRLDSLYPRTNDFAYSILGPILDKKRKMLYPVYFQDFTPLTDSIPIPALVIAGTEDHATGLDHYRLFRFPRQTLVRIRGGHLLYYEQTDEFINAVARFVQTAESERHE